MARLYVKIKDQDNVVVAPFPGGCKKAAASIKNGKHTANAGCASHRTVFQNHMGLAHSKSGTEIAVSCHNCHVPGNAAADYALHLSLEKQAVGSTDSKGKCPHRQPPLLVLVIFCFLENIINSSGKQEAALRNAVALTIQDHLESAESLFERNILSRHTGKLLCYGEAL